MLCFLTGRITPFLVYLGASISLPSHSVSKRTPINIRKQNVVQDPIRCLDASFATQLRPLELFSQNLKRIAKHCHFLLSAPLSGISLAISRPSSNGGNPISLMPPVSQHYLFGEAEEKPYTGTS